MADHYIENKYLRLKVSDHGGEMRSLLRLSDGKKLLWQADPSYWGRTSPILFPLVGNYRNKKSVYNGKEYSMTQHGFARDMDFELKEKTEDTIWFELKDNEITKEKYPFSFILRLGYILSGEKLKVLWEVYDTDERKIYFSIGGHPAFYCDMQNGELGFEKEGKIVNGSLISGIIEADGSGCLSDREKELSLEKGRLKLSPGLFDEDALIIENRQADAVSIFDKEGKSVLKVSFDSPLFGIWSPAGKNAPFVCIEPWYGRCDKSDFSGTLEEREYGNTLEPGEKFSVSYEISIG